METIQLVLIIIILFLLNIAIHLDYRHDKLRAKVWLQLRKGVAVSSFTSVLKRAVNELDKEDDDERLFRKLTTKITPIEKYNILTQLLQTTETTEETIVQNIREASDNNNVNLRVQANILPVLNPLGSSIGIIGGGIGGGIGGAIGGGIGSSLRLN